MALICKKCNSPMACTKCGCTDADEDITICRRMIARKRAKEITTLSRKILTIEHEKRESMKQTKNLLLSMENGKVFTNKEFLHMLGWSPTSDGDLTRKLLDWHTCTGIIKKIEFNKSRKGHTYKNEKIGKCEYLNSGECDICTFSFSEDDGAIRIPQGKREM